MLPSTNLPREQAWLLAVLALIAGYVDAYTFLNYQVYGSFMSGNTTQTGLNAGEGDLAGAGYNFLPIPIFVAGVFVGTFLVYSCLANRLRCCSRSSRRCCYSASRPWLSRRARPGSASSR